MKDMRDIDDTMGELLHAIHITNPEVKSDSATHFYDHGEYGLALEDLVGFLSEKEILLNENSLKKLSSLAEKMNMKEDSIVGKYLKEIGAAS